MAGELEASIYAYLVSKGYNEAAEKLKKKSPSVSSFFSFSVIYILGAPLRAHIHAATCISLCVCVYICTIFFDKV